MSKFNKKEHWENIYQTKKLENVSWYQKEPTTSLGFIKEFNIPKSAAIIDVGGGDSFFVDFLLDEGYQNLTVLDISEAGILRAKKRLGQRADKVKWIVADAATFSTEEKYDFWHDRAAFHFLTDEEDIENYINNVNKYLSKKGILAIGTFAIDGPIKCSGIAIQQYSEASMSAKFGKYFKKINCFKTEHPTPFNTSQRFVFCTFKR